MSAPRYVPGAPVVFRPGRDSGTHGDRHLGLYVRGAAWRGMHVVATYDGDGYRREELVRTEDAWPLAGLPAAEAACRLDWSREVQEMAEADRRWWAGFRDVAAAEARARLWWPDLPPARP